MKAFFCICIFACSIFTYTSACGQSKVEVQDLTDLESVIKQDMKTSGAPGAAIAIVKGEKIAYEKAFGLANSVTKRPVKTHTIFQAASVTKLLTALALLAVLEKENMDLNTEIGTSIPELTKRVSKITLHQLLSHTSGIMDRWPNKSGCKEEVIKYFTEPGDDILFEEPGAVFSYSNSGYILTGLVLSRLTSQSYEQAIQDLIFSPLDMNHSSFDLNHVITGSFANGHRFYPYEKKVVPVEFALTDTRMQPAGGLFTNIHDMARLASALMNDGNLDGKQVFDKNVVSQLQTVISSLGIQHQNFGYPKSSYSYGSINFEYRGIKFFGHTGDAYGQNALFGIAPNHDTAIIIFSNAGGYPFIHSFEKAADLFLPVKEKIVGPSFNSTNIENLVGKYYHPDIQNPKSDWIEILSRNDSLYIDIGFGGEYPLKQVGNLKYQFSHPFYLFSPEIKFIKDEKGRIKYLNSMWRIYVKSD